MGWPSSKRTYMVFPLSTLSSYPLDIHIEKAPSSASPCMPAWRRTCTPDSASAALRVRRQSVNSLRHDNHTPSSMHSLWGKSRADLHALDMSKRSPIAVWNTMFAQCFRKKLKSSLPRCHCWFTVLSFWWLIIDIKLLICQFWGAEFIYRDQYNTILASWLEKFRYCSSRCMIHVMLNTGWDSKGNVEETN